MDPVLEAPVGPVGPVGPEGPPLGPVAPVGPVGPAPPPLTKGMKVSNPMHTACAGQYHANLFLG